MKRSRIVPLALIVVGASIAVVLGLVNLMAFEHDDWLERSYQNRWVFRDVPARRGSLSDRHGATIAFDVPGFDLELDYRSFRRRHAVGAAVHGATLLASLRGSDETFDFAGTVDLSTALREVLDVPVAFVSESPYPWRAAQDLRFYASSLLSSLAGVSMRVISLALWRAAEDGRRDPVRVVAAEIDGWPAVDLEQRFADRIRQLDGLDRRLRRIDPKSDLWAALQQRRVESIEWRLFAGLPKEERHALADRRFWPFLSERDPWEDWQDWLAFAPERRAARIAEFEELRDTLSQPEPGAEEGPVFRNEATPRAIRRRIPHALAAWVGTLKEDLPGFVLRPAVQRERGVLPPSFAIYLGSVTPYWADDGATVVSDQVDAAAQTSASQRFLERTSVSVPAGLEGVLQDEFETTLYRHYSAFGRRGRGGVEQQLDPELRGLPGLRLVERDKRARERKLFQTLDVTAGKNVRLSIDLRLQEVLEQAITDLGDSAERGVALIDPLSGDVLALAGRRLRTKDGVSEERWSLAPAYPRGIASIGSIVKPFLLLEYLEARAADPELPGPETFTDCPERVRVGGRLLTCSHDHTIDQVRDPVVALGESCNFFYFQVTGHLGRSGLERALTRAGWLGTFDADGRVTSVGAYQSDIVGLPQRFHMWSRFEPRSGLPYESIGYGVYVSALQVARSYAALATGSFPTLGFVRDQRRPRHRLAVAPVNLDAVRAGLHYCVARGTAARIDTLARFGVRGKTGTCEIDRLIGGQKEERHNAWFAGYLGEDDRAALAFAAVAYGDTGYGGAVAGELIGRILEAMEADPELRQYLTREP